MNKPIALDICCRMGGATVGLQRAGFHVIGVDIEPQPGYPGDEFIKADGLEVLGEIAAWGYFPFSRLPRPALIWQSWPCQEGNTARMTNVKRGIADNHVQFIPAARKLSDIIGVPYVLEQPTSSRKGLIRQDVTLCMDMFRGDRPPPWVMKHRSFELGAWTMPARIAHTGSTRVTSAVGGTASTAMARTWRPMARAVAREPRRRSRTPWTSTG